MKTALHVIDTTGPGGAETVFLELSERVQQHNYKTVGVITGPGWVENQLKRRNVEYVVIPPHKFGVFHYLYKLIQVAKQRNAVLIQSHLLGSALVSAAVGRIAGIPVVATFHGQVDISPNERFLWMKSKLLEFGTKKVVAVSDSLADFFVRSGVVSRSKVETVYNGIDFSKYGKNSLTAVRNFLGLGSDAILVGSLGNIRPAKD